MKLFLLSLFLSNAALSIPLGQDSPGLERARALKDYIQKEKPRFEKRETRRRDILGELDHLNAQQNQVRERIAGILVNQQEMSMALENLSMELEKERSLERLQRKRLLLLLKIAYQVKKDGILRFLMNGDRVSSLTARVSILYHALRSHTQITRQLQERAVRLAQAEKKVNEAKESIQHLLLELKDQEDILDSLLSEKHHMLYVLNQKQTFFQSALREFKQVSRELATLFNNFESERDSEDSNLPNRGTLMLPVQAGHLVQGFGRAVNQKFHTVIYHKGIEIESEHNSPVAAVLSGEVEFEGWVKGLGNVLIIHHGGGFYSLSAHLFKTLKTRGSHVEQGEVVGYVGDTGNDEKPSLYFELRENGKAVDPARYFSRQAFASLRERAG